MQVKLFIDTVERTANLLNDEWSFERTTLEAIDILTVGIDDPSNSLLGAIDVGMDVVLEKFSDAAVDYFGGVIVNIGDDPDGGIGSKLTITCQDWTLILERSSFTKTYEDQADDVIIADMFTEAGVTEIDATTNVQQMKTNIVRLDFKGVTLRSALDTISGISGAIWYVDPYKKLNYHAEAYQSAPFQLSDVPNEVSSFPYYQMRRVRDLANYNAVEVRGTRKLSGDTVDVYSGDGSRKTFNLTKDGVVSGNSYHLMVVPESGQSRIRIYKNTGTDGTPVWTAQGVGIEGSDTLGGSADVLINIAGQQVIWSSAPPNFANNSWKIQGKYTMAVYARLEDDPAIASSGRMFLKVINDSGIQSIDEAYDVAEAFLSRQSNSVRLTLVTENDILAPGELISVTNARMGYTNKVFVIEKAGSRMLGPTLARHTITMRAV